MEGHYERLEPMATAHCQFVEFQETREGESVRKSDGAGKAHI